FFDPQRDLRVVTRAEDVEEALETPDCNLQSMAVRARQRTLEEHTGVVRARQLLEYLEQARSHSPASIENEVGRWSELFMRQAPASASSPWDAPRSCCLWARGWWPAWSVPRLYQSIW